MGTEETTAPAPAPASGGGKRKAAKPSRASRVKSTRTRPSVAETPVAPVAASEAAPAARVEAPATAEIPAVEPTQAIPAYPGSRVARPAAPATPARSARSAARADSPAAERPHHNAPARGRRVATERAPKKAPSRKLSLPAFPTPEPVEPPRAARSGHVGGRKNLFGLPSAPSVVGAAALALAAAGAVTVSSSGLGSQLAGGDIQKVSAQASVLNGATSIGSSDALSSRQNAVSRDSERQAQQDAADQKLLAAAEAQAKERNAALAALAASAEKHASYIAKNAWQLPITSGVYHLTSTFGECSALWSHCHTGLDFAADSGTPIHAVAGGVVTETAYSGAYGNRTIVTLEDGTEIWYCHQTSFSVSTGQEVRSGDVIGTVGSTGNVTGPHLHLEVRPGAGDPVDPYAALLAHGVDPG